MWRVGQGEAEMCSFHVSQGTTELRHCHLVRSPWGHPRTDSQLRHLYGRGRDWDLLSKMQVLVL